MRAHSNLILTSRPHNSEAKLENVRRPIRRVRTRFYSLSVCITALLIALPFITVSSSSVDQPIFSRVEAVDSGKRSLILTNSRPASAAVLFSPKLSLQDPQPNEEILTFAADCTTPKADFNLGETVCAKATGVPSSLFPWKILWIDPNGFIEQSQTAIANDLTTYQFAIPSSSTSFVNGQLVDNRGAWRVYLARASGVRRQSAVFTVHDTAQPAADLFVQKFERTGGAAITVGGTIPFVIVLGNSGPDAALTVHLVDSVPASFNVVSFTQQSGPSCTPAGQGDCTIASLATGQRAEFTVIYDTANAGAGTFLTSATATSTTADLDDPDNTGSTEIELGTSSGNSGCSIICPTSPAPVNNEPGTNGAHVSFEAPVTTGECGSVTTSASSGAFFPIGTSTITASTESGESCTFAVTVNDNENPTISCPSNIATFESAQGSGSAIVNYSVTANDNSATAIVDCDQPSGSSFSLGTTQVTCSASDESGRTATCTFQVTVNPVNTTCTLTPPPPIVVNSDANACGSVVTYEVSGNESCGTITCDRASGSFFPVGETLVTCTSNPDGATSSFTVTVNDNVAPVPNVSSLPTITSDCAVSTTPPTATDNCGGQIGGNTDDPRTYEDPGTFVVHWTFTDASGNVSTQDQTVIVTGNDSTPPVPDLPGLPIVSGECSVTVGTTPTASDNCSGEIIGTTSDPLTYTTAGTYTINWSFTDQNGNTSHQPQTVLVTDTVAPTVTLVGPGSVTVECHTNFTDPGVTTTDNCSLANVSVITTGAVDVNTPGAYTLVYTATDSGGNQASATRTVNVVDTTSPSVTLNGPASITVECHTAFSDPGAVASDSCDSTVPVSVSGSVNVDAPGTYTLLYNAVDDAGNAAPTMTRTVVVSDTTAPTTTFNSATIFLNNFTFVFNQNTVTVNGQVYPFDGVSFSHDGNSFSFNGQTITVNGISYTLEGATLVLWLPLYQYQVVRVSDLIATASDGCDSGIDRDEVVISHVTSDEAVNTPGPDDGNTNNDIVIAPDCKSVQLRAERANSGDGRVYTITFRVRDASGNTTTATSTIRVRRFPFQAAVDSGPQYTVTGTCP